MNNKTKAIIAVAALTCLCMSGTVFAYLTATDTKTNTFTIGNVDGELSEPSYSESDAVLFPGREVAKDPTVTNTGNTDALVFIEYTIPMATVSTVDSSGEAEAAVNQELFTVLDDSKAVGVNDEWIEIKDADYVQEDGATVGKTYYYAYNGILAKDTATTPIFNKVKLLKYATGDDLEETVSIEVKAKLIQADNMHMADDSVTQSELEDAYDYFVRQEE